jgi:hypothetical protein
LLGFLSHEGFPGKNAFYCICDCLCFIDPITVAIGLDVVTIKFKILTCGSGFRMGTSTKVTYLISPTIVCYWLL